MQIKFKTLSLHKLAKMLGYCLTATKSWCEQYDVPIYSIDEKEFVFSCHAESVWVTNLIIHLRSEGNRYWKKALKNYLQ